MSVPTANDKHPSAPNIDLRVLGKQFVTDVYGKEVQDPSSYSYTWMADQVGHICLGILVYFAIVVIVGTLGKDWAAVRWWIDIPAWGTHGVEAAGVIVGALVVALYEFTTFLFDALKARGLFPVDTKLLAENAGIATAYMILGLGVGYAMQVAMRDNHPLRGAVIFAILFALAIVLAPKWLRQKINWQKADLPFVFRLANVPSKGITDLQAAALQTVVSDSAPPDQRPRQVVIGGPIGSGRTEMAAGIGTEFAFRKRKVRYLTLTALLELAQTLPPSRSDRNDSGPDNINYWPWTEAQVLVIDDVGPLISAQPDGTHSLKEFQRLLTSADQLGPAAEYLRKCHTVWVLGNHVQLQSGGASGAGASATLKDFAKVIIQHCGGESGKQVIIELAERPFPSAKKGQPSPVEIKELSVLGM